MANCYSFKGFVPVVPEDTFVHPQAVLIGNVVLGHGCYIGPGASLRGDFGKIEIGDGANIQDNCIIPDNFFTFDWFKEQIKAEDIEKRVFATEIASFYLSD